MQVWQPTFSVGHPALDEQHRRLLRLCRDSISCLESGVVDGIEQFHVLLDELCQYGRVHFATEEALLANCNYPLLDEQKADHLEYEEKLADFLLAATFGEFDRAGVARYLSEWWTRHVLESDMQFREFLLERFPAGA